MWRKFAGSRYANGEGRKWSNATSSRTRRDSADPVWICNCRHPTSDALNRVWRNWDHVLSDTHASRDWSDSRLSKAADAVSQPDPLKATRRLELEQLARQVSIAGVPRGAATGACSPGQLARSGTMRQNPRDTNLSPVGPRQGLGGNDTRFGRSVDEGRRRLHSAWMNPDQRVKWSPAGQSPVR